MYQVPSLGAAWLLSVSLVLSNGEWIVDDEQRLLEIRPLMLNIAAVDEDDPVIREFASHSRIELMIRKYRSLRVLPQYNISYGRLLYNFDGVDQIEWVTDRLRGKPESKSATITMHKPGENELSCLSLLDFKLRGERLNMTAVYRSQNIYASQPGNVLALRGIQSDVALQLGVAQGSFGLVVLSAHIYEMDVEGARLLPSPTEV
jgi:thymidylate synthase